MNPLALILGVVAVVLFAVEGVRTRALVPWGLAALTAMLMAMWLIQSNDAIHF